MLKAFARYSRIIFAGIVLAAAAGAVMAQDMTIDALLTKHLDSIGTKDKRDAAQSRIARGISTFESKLPQKVADGKAILVTDPNNLYFISAFNSKEYPFEKIGLFSNKVSLPYITAGTRSPLGAFIADHNGLLNDGLFGGTISSLWGLQSPKGKLEIKGKKKIDGKDTYVVNYYPKGGGAEFTVKMYFDAVTFQHVRTEYKNTIDAKHREIGVMGEQTGSTISLTEIFGDYRDESGLMLPHTYKIQYLTDSNSGTYEYDWSLNIGQYFFNQKLAPNFFSFDEQK
jgi:hypothetical protein